MKYLRKFETEADVMMMVQPNVVLVGDEARILYNVEPLKGAFIQHINGYLYTTDQWTAMGFANSEANGVAVIGDNAKFVISKIAPTAINSVNWSSDTKNVVAGVVLTESSDTAKTDYAGEANTTLIAVDDTSGAALGCANFTFPNGRKGYLPALGEWVEAYKYKADVEAAMTLIGGVDLTVDSYYWSSTQSKANAAWRYSWHNGELTTTHKGSYIPARAFSAL